MTRIPLRLKSAALVFALALVTRVLFLYATSDRGWPHSVFYEGDATVFARWAQALDRGEPFEFDLPMRTPAVAFALHWLAPGVIAAPFTLLKLLWCAISAATCAMVFAVVERERSARAAWIASILTCFSFGAYELATSLNSEAPYAFLLVLLLGATLRWVRGPGPLLALAIGVLHGIALLLRAEHTLLLAGFLLWCGLALRNRRAWVGLALTAAAALLVCLPWVWRSHLATQRFNAVAAEAIDFQAAVPPWTDDAREFLGGLPAFAREGNFAYASFLARSKAVKEVDRAYLERYFDEQFAYVPEPLAEWTLASSKGALDFALANHPESRGGFSRAALFDGTDAAPEFAFGRPSHLKLYNHGVDVGLGWIRADFGAWGRLAGQKFERFFAGATLGFTAYDLPHSRANLRRPVDLATPIESSTVFRVLLAIGVLWGMLLAWRGGLGGLCLLVIGYKLVITALYYGYARQAVSIQAVFFVFAAIAIDALLTRVKLPAKLTLGLGLATVIGLLGCDISNFGADTAYDIRATDPKTVISTTAEWGTGAFECTEEIQITPR